MEVNRVRSHRPSHLAVSSREGFERGTVVGPHERSVEAGLEMYERGGNAIDAAVAAALVAGVIEPTETTLAGSGFLLYNDGKTGPMSVEFGPKAPLASSASMYRINPDADSSAVLGLAPVLDAANVDGALAAGVPRTLLGLLTAQQRWGSLSRDVICQPAVSAAYDGFAADGWFLTNALSDLARLRSHDETRRLFLDDDGLPVGHRSWANYGPSFDVRPRISQPKLGATLEEVSRTPLSTLTTGSIAEHLVETSREMGGLLSLADLREAAPTIAPARTMEYRGVDISVPSSPGGGITELQVLAIWHALNPEPSTSHESPEQTRKLALALRHAFADRYHWLGDPSVVPVPTDGLLSAGYARAIAGLCESGENVAHWGDGAPWLTYASTPVHDPWSYSKRSTTPPQWQPHSASEPTTGTTHISAADADGRIVSITHTAANHFGNGVVCPRTGLLFDSAMAWFNAAPGAANSISSGARALANMGPALITQDGASVAALGASGGRRIISAVAQLLINIIDGRCSIAEALQLPRIDASGGTILVHEGRAHHFDALADLGATLVPYSHDPFTMDFARPNLAGFTAPGHTASAIDSTAYGD